MIDALNNELSKLYNSAMTFMDLGINDVIRENNIFSIRYMNRTYYCMTMSEKCDEAGLCVFLRPKGLIEYVKYIINEDNMYLGSALDTTDALLCNDIVKCSFLPQEMIAADEMDRYNELGIDISGRELVPSCTIMNKGQVEEMLTDISYIKLLQTCFNHAKALADRVMVGELELPDYNEEHEVVDIYKTKDDYQFILRKINEANEVGYDRIILGNAKKLEKLSSIIATQSTWEVRTGILCMPLINDKGRINYPSFITALDKESGQLIYFDAVDDTDANYYVDRKHILINRFIDKMIANNLKPECIQVAKDEDYLAFEYLCKTCYIDIIKERHTDVFNSFMHKVIGFTLASSLSSLKEFKAKVEFMYTGVMNANDSVTNQHQYKDVKQYMHNKYTVKINESNIKESNVTDELCIPGLAMAVVTEAIVQDMFADYNEGILSDDEKERISNNVFVFTRMTLALFNKMPSSWDENIIKYMFIREIPYLRVYNRNILYAFIDDINMFIKYLVNVGLIDEKPGKPMLDMMKSIKDEYISIVSEGINDSVFSYTELIEDKYNMLNLEEVQHERENVYTIEAEKKEKVTRISQNTSENRAMEIRKQKAKTSLRGLY